MGKYYDTKELAELVEFVLGSAMDSSEKALFDAKVSYFENPRYGYEVINDKNIVLSRLSSGDYYIEDFLGGKGFCMKHGGGCFGYIDDDLLNTMILENLISDNGRILSQGFVELGKYHAHRQ
jgi:hypothetical protein